MSPKKKTTNKKTRQCEPKAKGNSSKNSNKKIGKQACKNETTGKTMTVKKKSRSGPSGKSGWKRSWEKLFHKDKKDAGTQTCEVMDACVQTGVEESRWKQKMAAALDGIDCTEPLPEPFDMWDDPNPVAVTLYRSVIANLGG
eukprot:TRINITY_DN59236_c0_g1_i1.p1 TRINITY_DN59236_c0_g1~~TRINITY_DN59236_c0_g1_i1.p1  ORF type:complete len:142 (+),score=31.89 TRINITY_DN59236_c0_g1_i1:69-494(+)